jgi:hypothetical protein
MMEALRYSETFVLTRATLRNIPEDSNLQSGRFLNECPEWTVLRERRE